MVSQVSAAHEGALAAEPAGHRERLIAAMAASIEEKGYRDTTVADVVRLARTSRRNFYEHFADRDACFLALFDATNEAMMREIAGAVRPDRPLDEQVDRAVDAYIHNVAATPALYRSFVRELPGLGQAGVDRGLATLEPFGEMLVGFVGAGPTGQRVTCALCRWTRRSSSWGAWASCWSSRCSAGATCASCAPAPGRRSRPS